MTWVNEYGDTLDESDREEFIDDEMVNDQEASGIVGDRANAERVFNQQHKVVAA